MRHKSSLNPVINPANATCFHTYTYIYILYMLRMTIYTRCKVLPGLSTEAHQQFLNLAWSQSGFTRSLRQDLWYEFCTIPNWPLPSQNTSAMLDMALGHGKHQALTIQVGVGIREKPSQAHMASMRPGHSFKHVASGNVKP